MMVTRGKQLLWRLLLNHLSILWEKDKSDTSALATEQQFQDKKIV